MSHTHHSEYLPLHSVMVKTVDKAFVSQDKIDQEWKGLN